MRTITISHGEWGYVQRLSDFSGGKIAEALQTPDGKHTLTPMRDGDDNIYPGEPDSRQRRYGGFGFVRPPREGEDEELWDRWRKDPGECHDYYVSLRNGCPDPESTPLLYPDRVFVTGEDDEGDDLSRTELLKHFGAVGLYSHPCYWEPVQMYTGLNKGFPVFRAALKADTGLGMSWYSVNSKLRGGLPTGYEWDHYAASLYGMLYYDPE